MREGECQQLRREQIGPDLLSLVQNPDQYSHHRDSTTVFDSTGWALEDYITMKLLLQYGRDLGCGTPVSLADLTQDPHNPYAGLGLSAETDRFAV